MNASVNAMAIATITHNDLAGAGGQADALDQIVASSQDLRGDLRANSAITLASYKVELQQLAVLTSMLEVYAMGNITDTSLYHEKGGSSFPDALIDADFSPQSPDVRINVTPPQQGSSGGFGLGGALLSSVGGGDNSISNILSGSGLGTENAVPQSITELADSIKAGTTPSVRPEDLSMSSITADAASVANISMKESGAPKSLQTSMSMIQNGLAAGTPEGNTSAMMGLAQTIATTDGNETLATALNSGSLAIQSNDPKAATSFAKGVLRDIKKVGVTGQYVSLIENGIAGVESGTQSSSNLVLDSAAIFSALGSDANSRVSDILQIDPSGVTETYFRDSLAGALDDVAAFTGDANISGIAGTCAQ